MKKSLTILLFGCVGSGVTFSQSISGLGFEAVFDFVEDGMPAAFEVGHSVFFEFDLDTGVEGATIGSFTSYAEAVTDFFMIVPDASFEVALDLGTLSLPGGSSEVWISLPGSGHTFQDQELLSVDLVLDVSDGGSRFESFSDSEIYFAQAVLASWSVSFVDADGFATSTGSVSALVPEPRAYSFVLGMAVLMLVAARRMRNHH